MSKFNNRKIWGIELPLAFEMPASPYINYGEGKYGYVDWKTFVENLHTVSIPINGPIKYKIIRKYKSHTIKIQLNGTTGFSIWKGKICLEDNIWSIDKAENAIDEMRGV